MMSVPSLEKPRDVVTPRTVHFQVNMQRLHRELLRKTARDEAHDPLLQPGASRVLRRSFWEEETPHPSAMHTLPPLRESDEPSDEHGHPSRKKSGIVIAI